MADVKIVQQFTSACNNIQGATLINCYEIKLTLISATEHAKIRWTEIGMKCNKIFPVRGLLC